MLDEKYIDSIKKMSLQELAQLKEIIKTKENELNSPIKLFDYQNFVLNFKRNHLICNWCRGLGKTYTIALLIYKNRPRRVIYSSKWRRGLSILQDKFKEMKNQYILSDVKRMIMNKNKISIKYYDGSYTEIFNLNRDINNDKAYDYIFFDDKLPYALNIKAKQVISFITTNNRGHWLEQLFPQCVVDNQNYKTGIKNNILIPDITDTYKNYIGIFKKELDILN